MARKTGNSISAAVSEYLNSPEGTGADISRLSVNVISEKVFTGGYEYTVDISSRSTKSGPRRPVSDEEINSAKTILEDLLSLSGFRNFSVRQKEENGFIIFRIEAGAKDGLLIGKEGRNITALQYLLANAMEKKLGRPAPFIIDIDTYMEKRLQRLKVSARALCATAAAEKREMATELLPSYERKVIHEEISFNFPNLKTFSVGRGQYKKVIITPLI